MGFAEAVKSVLSQYVNFGGRAVRSEYWYWVLALVLIGVVLAIIDGAIVAPALGFEAFAPDAGQPLSSLFSLAIFLPTLAVAVRRLHDIGKRGWWVLIGLIPLLGGLVLIWFYVQPSETEANAWGEPRS
ncbi:DUF805 domain-containing protein [Halioglobus pacificus]|uniref:DUF805 domain-containing protein n=1 Tax=Parahalioglobus pacificus TaxID=930806 RepID=A0A918XFC2_9GAMM|nr:DUF805 domain-containing protein [Halioglobus pacificus]NQY02432.1 DUF805 domain-containing protein [Halieaceae bacterium]GHD29244.1 DUF805 domain-containing protein [Halioglobus pacificus]